MDPSTITFTVNDHKRSLTTDPRRPLLDCLREDCALTGAKYGCGEGQCGACTVLVDGKRTFSCITPASEVDGKRITTIEGLAKGEALHPVQQAFIDENAFQCGYCTPGMILATVALLAEKPHPSDADLTSRMTTNLCRCCGYGNIRKAVERAVASNANAARSS